MKKVLIVDDNLEVCMLYKTLVSQMGYSVRITTNPLEALEWLGQETFDLILTDMRMPVMGGVEFIQRARNKGVKSKVIAITAFQNLSNANQLAHLDIYTCLIKPVILTKLEEIIQRALSSSDSETKNSTGSVGQSPNSSENAS